jgi:hypothetical protein
LTVRTGPLKVGTVIRLTTPDGLFVGAIMPFGLAGKPASLEFQIAVPPEAVKGTDLVFDTEILDPGTPSPRAPTQAELIAIEALVQ